MDDDSDDIVFVEEVIKTKITQIDRYITIVEKVPDPPIRVELNVNALPVQNTIVSLQPSVSNNITIVEKPQDPPIRGSSDEDVAPTESIVLSQTPIVEENDADMNNEDDNTADDEGGYSIDCCLPGRYYIMTKMDNIFGFKKHLEAYRFISSNINLHSMRPSSRPKTLYPLSSTDAKYSAVRCLSLLLTGSEDRYLDVDEIFKASFYNNFNHIGFWQNQDFSTFTYLTPLIRQTILSKHITDTHWQYLAIVMGCRFGIYQDQKLRYFEDLRNNDKDIPLFIFDCKDDYYQLATSIDN